MFFRFNKARDGQTDGRADRLTCSYTVLCMQALCIAACCNKIVLCWHAEHHYTAYFAKVFSFSATVCKTVRPILSDRCLSVCHVLSVMLVYGGQTDGSK